MKKLLYITNARIPTEKAHGIQIMKMCEAFSKAGAKVELVVPKRKNPITTDPFEYYSVEKNFSIKKLFNFDIRSLGPLRFYLQLLSFSLSALFFVIKSDADYIYSRTEFLLFFLSFFKKNLYWEMHTKSNKKMSLAVARRVKKVVAISNGLKQYLIENGIQEDKILVAHDGVDLAEFDISKSKEELREELELPKDKKIIGYVGKMSGVGESKGVGGIIEAFSLLHKKNINIFLMLVGANHDEREGLRKLLKKYNIGEEKCALIGHVLHAYIPKHLKAADVLVMNYSSSDHFFSPLKLFEYMASGTMIVTSDTPNIREVLNENNAVLVEPDNPESLVEGINKLLNDLELSGKISKQTFEDVQKYSWQKRADQILNFI